MLSRFRPCLAYNLAFPALILLAFAPAGPANRALDQKVTLTSAARPAAEVLADISTQAGMTLNATGVARQEMLVVRMRDVPLADAMKRIAQATTAEWQKSETGYTLVRTSAVVDRIHRAERAKRIKDLQEAFDRLRKSLDKQPPLTAAAIAAERARIEEYREDREEGERPIRRSETLMQPPERALAALILSRFTPGELADVPSDGRVVYSTLPNRLQKPLGNGLQSLMQQLDRDLKVVNDTNNALNKAQQVEADFGSVTLGDSWPLATSARGGTTRLVVSFTAEEPDGKFQMIASNALGELTAYGTVRLQGDRDESTEEPETKPVPVVLSPQAIEEYTFYARANDEKAQEPFTPSAELRDRLLKPEKYEPLAGWPSEALLKAAEANEANLVACIADEALYYTGMADGQTPTTDEDWIYEATCAGEVTREDGWIVTRSTEPLMMAPYHADRAVLGNFLRRVVTSGYLSIEEWVSYCRIAKDSATLASTDIAGFLDVATPSYDWDGFCELFSSLNPEQRKAMAEGKPLPWERMTPSQQAAVTRLVYQDLTYVRPEPVEESEEGTVDTDEARSPEAEARQAAEYRAMMCWMYEITEGVPERLGQGVYLTMTDDSTPRFRVRSMSDSGEAYLSDVGQEAIAMAVLRQRRPDLFEDEVGFPLDYIRLGSTRQVEFTVHLPGRRFGSESAEMHQVGKEVLKYDALPADIRKQIEVSVAEMIKNMQDDPPAKRHRR